MGLRQCQIHLINEIADPLNATSIAQQKLIRLKRIIKRRWWFARNFLSAYLNSHEKEAAVDEKLMPGDLVRVRTLEDIKNTLDNWNRKNRCVFMEEMAVYCGTVHRVFKRVEKFLDERDYLVRRSKGIVLLDEVICEGTKDFGRCDRSCFFFWREEWLERITPAQSDKAVHIYCRHEGNCEPQNR